MFGSTVPAQIDSPLVLLPGGLSRVEGTIQYSRIQPAFLDRIRHDWVDYRLTGSLVTPYGPRQADWRGRVDRPYVRFKEPLTDVLGRFVELERISIGSVGLRQSAVNMNVAIRQPLPFDLSFHKLSYALEIHGRVVGFGEREAFSLHGNQRNILQMPVRLDHSALLSALGSSVWKRGEIAGDLAGTGRLKLSSGEEDFSFRLPVRISLL
ncbi:MAG: LEA type 2 family protein [Deltaproteobacteria bacterium]|nr:LEA type 2 family protein [Deltaproteobacteria bacterium]